MMRGDREAIGRLHAAGAKGSKGWTVAPTKSRPARSFQEGIARIADSITKTIPMIRVPDIARTLDWYTTIGFKEVGRFPEKGEPNWGMLQFGKAAFMLSLGGKAGPHDVTLWFYTDKVDELYDQLKTRQIEALGAATGEQQVVEFVADIHNPEYGGREFGIRDLNGYILYFRFGG